MARDLLCIVGVVLLFLILLCLIDINQTIDAKGINMHLYQRISTDHCSWRVETSKGTVIHMNAQPSLPKEEPTNESNKDQ